MQRAYKIKRFFLLAVGLAVCPCFVYGQKKWKVINSVEEMEEIARSASEPAVIIAYYLGGAFALFSLINVFKGVQQGDDETSRKAGGWLVALCVYLAGIWIVDKFILGKV
jgi:formate hydrogenlyase subunit 3/multisubunit Na+/H+ antiporter MnhD subunit